MASPAGSANGGIIGKLNQASFGKCTVTSTTPTGSSTVTLQPGTRIVDTLIVGGGGGGAGYFIGGGGGAGGFRTIESINAQGNVTATIGAGGTAGATTNPGKGGDGNDSTLMACGVTYTSTGGGAGAWSGSSSGGVGNTGGSGGGGMYDGCQAGGAGNTPPVSPSQGNNGGAGVGNISTSP